MAEQWQEPCNTCGYEEGSIYCKEHCPHEAKIEQELTEFEEIDFMQEHKKIPVTLDLTSCDDVISRHAAIKAITNTSGIRGDALNALYDLPPVNPQPCEDAISRQAVIGGINRYFHDEYYQRTSIQDCRDCLIEDVINKLPPVTPQQSCEDIAKAFQLGMALGFAKKHDEMDKIMEEVKKVVIPESKTGHWISHHGCEYECSECRDKQRTKSNYCPNCGAKMIESQERSDKE